jgi:hypothetical protein
MRDFASRAYAASRIIFEGRHAGVTAEFSAVVKVAEGVCFNNHFYGCPFADTINGEQ